MHIEGLGQSNPWYEPFGLGRPGPKLKPEQLQVGKEIVNGMAGTEWVVTDVLGDGKFKAVPKDLRIDFNGERYHWRNIPEKHKSLVDARAETFDISGKIDTDNSIYKFYEKDVQKYLNKFGGKKVTDDKGVSWIEIPIKKEWARMPVEAFGLVPLLVPLSSKKDN